MQIVVGKIPGIAFINLLITNFVLVLQNSISECCIYFGYDNLIRCLFRRSTQNVYSRMSTKLVLQRLMTIVPGQINNNIIICCKYERIGAKTCWIKIYIMCPSKAICLFIDCFYSELTFIII